MKFKVREHYENKTEQNGYDAEYISEKPSPKGVTAAALKNIALITMLIDHVGAAVLLYFTSYYCGEGQYTGIVDSVYQVLRWIGRTSFPIYCFLLVEGFWHTRSLKRYLGRLFVFALVSELPYNLAFYDSLWYRDGQNVFFTLLLGLLAMAVWHGAMENEERLGDFRFPVAVLGVAACIAAAYYMKTDYDVSGVCLILIFYFWRSRRGVACLVGYLCMLYEPWCLPAFLLIMAYNGEKGVSRRGKYFFYAFYPQHLCYLVILRLLVLSALGMEGE